MINPFIITNRIEKKYFCDRVEESATLIRLITNGNNVVLISPRRMGKTGLIYYCFEESEIKQKYNTFFIDILQTTTLREFIFLLGNEIFRTLAPRGKRIMMKFIQTLKTLSGKLSIDPVTGAPTFNLQLGDIQYPELTLNEIFEYLNNSDTPSIVAIDEFQQIVNYPEKNVEAILRTYIQKCGNTNFIFSGSQRHILGEMFMSSARPFFHSATIMNLEAIPRNIYVDFIVRNFEEKGKLISVDMAREIYDKFEGHTFYVQKTANEAFSSTPENGHCNEDTVKISIENILSSQATFYREILRNLTLRQKELLYAVATAGKATAITSETFIKSHSLGSASSVQSSLRTLLNKEILTRNEDTYWVYDRFFNLWLRQMLMA